MKRISLATLGMTFAAAVMAAPALAQSTPEQTQFGPLPPTTALAPEPAPAPYAPAPYAPAPPAPVMEESAVAPQPMELAPSAPAATEDEASAPTRRAAPTARPRATEPNPKTGPYLGHGLFDNYGPNDFGA